MDYTACALPFAVLLGFLFGVGATIWCMREPKPKQEQPKQELPPEKTLLEQQVDEIFQERGW